MTSKLILSMFVLTATNANAQMADASLFPEMKSVNPAVISRRSSARITATGRSEFTKKEQKLSTANGDAIDGEGSVDVNVNSFSLFRGGQGPGLTTELGGDYVMGTQKDKTISETETHSQTNTASNSLLYFGLGITENIGVSYSRASYKGDFKLDSNFSGQPATGTLSQEVTADDIKGGLRMGLGPVSLGAFYLNSVVKSKMKTSDNVFATGAETQKEEIVGAALGISAKTLHIEGGYETSFKSQFDPILNKELKPTRITGTIESRFGALSLGYTGRYYVDGFLEIERVIYNQFVYSNSFAEPRLDNTFNFGWGNSKGSALSGSIYYTAFKAKEVNTWFPSGNKVETKTLSYGASIMYSYVF